MKLFHFQDDRFVESMAHDMSMAGICFAGIGLMLTLEHQALNLVLQLALGGLLFALVAFVLLFMRRRFHVGSTVPLLVSIALCVIAIVGASGHMLHIQT